MMKNLEKKIYEAQEMDEFSLQRRRMTPKG
jgi:hypothetical protein